MLRIFVRSQTEKNRTSAPFSQSFSFPQKTGTCVYQHLPRRFATSTLNPTGDVGMFPAGVGV